MLQSIRREIHALSRIRHPGVVRVRDHGIEQGLPWYAMELLQGVSLRLWLEEQAPGPSLTRALTLVRRLCAPLAYLHGEGIVHRDLKPENILVQPGDRPVIVDFGLLLELAPVGRELLSVEEGVSGTLLYMAPEQIKGRLVDARADLYSLGCMLYELVTGQPPFTGDSVTELFKAHLSQPVRPPSSLVSDLPVQLDELICRLLTKRSQQRPGYAEDVAVVLAELGAAASDQEGPRPRPYLYRPGFTGRGDHLGYLRTHLQQLQRGVNRLVLVAGESGVGKTRLAVELAAEARRDQMQVVTGECRQVGGQPLAALHRVLLQIADHCRERGEEETRRVLGSHGRVLAAYEPELLALPGVARQPLPAPLDPGPARFRLYRSLLLTLAALTRKAPLLLILDDLQWADDLIIGFLSMVGQGAAGRHLPLLVIALYRQEEASESLLGLTGLEHARCLDLTRLDEAAVAAMAGDMLGHERPPAELTRYLFSRTEGNPFFVAEYLQAAVEEGLLCRDGEHGVWQVGNATGVAGAEAGSLQLPLPGSIREVVSRRLQGLSKSAWQVTAAAAVAGRETSLAMLEAMTGIDGTELTAILDELSRRQLLEETDQGRARFIHDQIREVAYQTQPEERCRRYHRQAAAAIESLYRADLDSHCTELAYHNDRAGLARQAGEWYARAGEQAVTRYAASEALDHLDRALELIPESELDSRFEILLLRESIHATSGQRRQQQDDLAALLALSRSLPQASRLAEVDLRRARHAQNTSDYATALTISGSAIEQARTAGEPALAAAGHLQRALALWRLGDFPASREQLAQALDLARTADAPQVEADSLRTLGNVFYYQGDYPQAIDSWQQALAISHRLGDRVGEASTLGNLGEGARSLGDYAESRQSSAQRLQICREIGDREGESIALANMSLVSHNLGDDQAAVDYGRQMLELARAIGNRSHQGYALNNLGHALTGLAMMASDRGQARRLLDEAADRYRRAAALRRELGEQFLAMESLAGLARVALVGEDPAQALTQVEEILRFLEVGSLDGTDEPLRVYLSCIQVLQACHDPRAAKILETAHALLQERAGRIPEPMRSSYLSQVNEHRELLQEL
jgi:predicted ATPase